MRKEQPVVVIVGAGFGGLNAAQALRNAPVDVLLLDKHNYHLFQPLLYQVATAGLAPTEIAYPIRTIFRKQKNFKFRLTEVTGLDLDRKVVETTTGPVHYDFLVLAPGGDTNYFGLQSVADNAIGLKNLDESIAIRNQLIKTFELAAQEQDPVACEALRTFVVVGGGPTGVEYAGALAELVHLVLRKDYPELIIDDVRVILLEMMDRLLAGFPDQLAEDAARRLKEKHVEVRFNAAVTDYDGNRVLLKDGTQIPSRTLVWAAGIRAVSLLDGTGLPQARQGRVVVEPTLQVPGRPEVFVVGDAAYMEEEGEALPMVAPVAIQQGKLAAGNIQRLLAGEALGTFEYRDPGQLATIGRSAAVARVKGFKFTGFLAWLVWLAVHLFWLIGFRNRLLVMINWAADYLFYERAVRVITPDGNPRTDDTPWPVGVAPKPAVKEETRV